MNKTFKQLLELTQIESALGRVKELDSFLDITRSFSLKCSGHLKVLTNLVNNLVESEDWLELADTPLLLPEKNRDGTGTPHPELTSNNAELDSAMGAIRQENERMMRMIERGESSTDFLRDLLSKLLQQVQNQ